MATILKILREGNCYTQEYVGKILGIGQNTYSKLENGLIRLTTDRINRLADLYLVNPEILVSRELPIINFNNGAITKGTNNAEKYSEQCSKFETEAIITLKERIIEEKDKQIMMLKEQLEEKKNEICFWRDFASKQK